MYCVSLFLFYTITRPCHLACAIARARTYTHANQLGREIHPTCKYAPSRHVIYAPSRQAFEIRSKMITEADSYHKDTNNETGTTIQLSNNEQPKGEQTQETKQGQKKISIYGKPENATKPSTRKTARVCKWPQTEPASAKENSIHR